MYNNVHQKKNYYYISNSLLLCCILPIKLFKCIEVITVHVTRFLCFFLRSSNHHVRGYGTPWGTISPVIWPKRMGYQIIVTPASIQDSVSKRNRLLFRGGLYSRKYLLWYLFFFLIIFCLNLLILSVFFFPLPWHPLLIFPLMVSSSH